MNISIKLARKSYILFLYYCCAANIITIPMTPQSTTTTTIPMTPTTPRKKITPKRPEKANILYPDNGVKYFRLGNENDRDKIKKLLASSLIFNQQKTELIAGENGNVYSLPIEKTHRQTYKKKELQFSHKKNMLFSHRFVTHSPMLLTGETKNGEDFIISAGNYYNTNYQIWNSEIIMYKNKSKSYTIKNFCDPIQSVKLCDGEDLLIIALRAYIILYNLTESKIEESKFFEPDKIEADKNQIINMAICPSNASIAVVGKNGALVIINIIQDTMFSLQKINVPKETKAVHYTDSNTILYLTDNHEIGIIKIFENLKDIEPKSSHSIDSKSKPSHSCSVFPHSEKYAKITFDTEKNNAAACWAHQYTTKQEKNLVIKVYQFNEKTNERKTFHLHAPFNKNGTYEIMSNKGYLETKKEHICTVNLSGNHVAALSSYGNIFIWNLPQQDTTESPLLIKRKHSHQTISNEYDEYEKYIAQLNALKISPDRKKGAIPKNAQTDPLKTTVSAPVLTLPHFKSPTSSKEATPYSSRESSPQRYSKKEPLHGQNQSTTINKRGSAPSSSNVLYHK